MPLRCRGGHLDLSAHRGRELADDRQAEPGAARVDDRVAAAAEEAAEDLLPLGGGHPGTLVVDDELGAALPPPDGHRIVVSAGEYFAALPTRLVTTRSTACSVPATRRPGRSRGTTLCWGARSGCASSMRPTTVRRGRAPCVRGGERRRRARGGRSPAGPRRARASRCALVSTRSAYVRALLGGELVPVVAEDPGVAGDDADRGAQLVGGGGEEDRLELVHRPHPLQQLALLGERLGVGQRRGQDVGDRGTAWPRRGGRGGDRPAR